MRRVTVIVPTYNGARHLRETLDAIGAQTRPADEVMVVDDRSTDNSLAIAQGHPVVTKAIPSAENAGVCAARNKGINASTGDLIAFCDQDDLWDPTKLEAQVRAMEVHPDADYLFTNFVHMRDGIVEKQDKFSQARKGWWRDAASTAETGMLILHRPALPRLLEFQPAFPSTMMVRRSLLERSGLFDEALGRERSEDLEFLLRCEDVGVIATLSWPLVTIRKHDGNYSTDTTKTTLSQIRILKAMTMPGSRYEEHRDLIEREIARRSIDAIDGLFAAGDMSTCLELAKQFPSVSRPGKQRAKIAIASLPTLMARRLAALLTR